MYSRCIAPPSKSFFLFGPRGTGKTTWLREALPDSVRIDLLNSATYLELLRSPERLEGMIGGVAEGKWVVLDEVQKVPALLDEVHRLIEEKGYLFALCGSSARKLKKGGANMLAGRALSRKMEGFTSNELSADFNLQQALEWGTMPFVQKDPVIASETLSAYLDTYLKEEIRAEGIVRKLEPFVRFLAIAGQLNGRELNVKNIAREASVARPTVDNYFSILYDTLLCHLLPAWRPGVKVREVAHPKLYWFDSGVARAAGGWLFDQPDRIWREISLETLIYHELRVFNQAGKRFRPMFYHRTPAGVEVDFVIETAKRTSVSPCKAVLVEVKLSSTWDRFWERPMRSLAESRNIRVTRMIGVYGGERSYHFDGVDVLAVEEFLRQLHDGEVF